MLGEFLGVGDFVNADIIAQGLSGFDPEGAAIEAGRIMLQRLRELANLRQDFAFETTLASRSFAPWIASLIKDGYRFRLIYVWVASADLCIARVAERVLAGGHHVPDVEVRRRYVRGVRNFFGLYRPLAEYWRVYDNSNPSGSRRVAEGRRLEATQVYNEPVWSAIQREFEESQSQET